MLPATLARAVFVPPREICLTKCLIRPFIQLAGQRKKIVGQSNHLTHKNLAVCAAVIRQLG